MYLCTKEEWMFAQWFHQDSTTPQIAIPSRFRQICFRTDSFQAKQDIRACLGRRIKHTLDFFLMRYIKSQAYENHPQKFMQLKLEIKKVIETVKQDTCKRVIDHFKRRVGLCVNNKGKHFELLLLDK